MPIVQFGLPRTQRMLHNIALTLILYTGPAGTTTFQPFHRCVILCPFFFHASATVCLSDRKQPPHARLSLYLLYFYRRISPISAYTAWKSNTASYDVCRTILYSRSTLTLHVRRGENSKYYPARCIIVIIIIMKAIHEQLVVIFFFFFIILYLCICQTAAAAT